LAHAHLSQTAEVPRQPVGYEIRHGETGTLLSRHRTRRAAVDNWRQHHLRLPVKIVRVYASGTEVLVVEGTWHVGMTVPQSR
jgi:hypothetical protein